MFYCVQLSLMGIQFEKLKKIIFRPTDRPIPVKQGQVRGNKNIFKVGLNDYGNCPNILNTSFSVLK